MTNKVGYVAALRGLQLEDTDVSERVDKYLEQSEMINTEDLYERIAAHEGYSWCPTQFSYPLFLGDGVHYSPKDFCFGLIVKYKLCIENENYEWCVMKHDIHCDLINVWHKNLENAVMLASLSISEGE